MTRYPPVTVVDEHNQIIGPLDRLQADQQGLWRQTVHVYIFDAAGRVIIQKRSQNVLWPLLFDKSAGGHVGFGDMYDQTAQKELAEELGIDGISLDSIGAPFKYEREFAAVYVGVISKSVQVVINESEVSEIVWMTTSELSNLMVHQPDLFVSHFRIAWEGYGERVCAVRDRILTARS